MPPSPYKLDKQDLSEIKGKRVGVEGNWFVRVVRSHLKREDPHWALNGPVSSAFEKIVSKFLAKLKQVNATPVFVFDGLYTRRQAHPALLLHSVDNRTDDLLHQVRDLEPLDEDAISYLIRLLVALNVEVMTAPYLAWPQLVYFHTKGHVDEIFGSLDVLTVPGSKRVLTEIGNLSDDKTMLHIASAENPDVMLEYQLSPQQLPKSPHWSWLQHNNAHEDFGHVRNTIVNCPIFTFDGKVKPYIKETDPPGSSHAMLRAYFFNDLGATTPIVYFLLSSNVLSPQLLNVAAAEQFIDDPPLIKSRQYDTTLERIIPLRTQIIFQLVQDLERFLKGFERIRNLKWERPHDEQHQPLPIQRPPKIALDEWAGVDPNPREPYTFKSVLRFSNQAKAVDETKQEPDVTYTSSAQALGAVLLKALDLLGYFTHAAHTTSEDEESSKSIFANALEASGKYSNECVLLIELTRTRSLHDTELDLNVHPSHQPRQPPMRGSRFAARVMSLLPLIVTPPKEDQTKFNLDVLAFNDIARAFQRNLRMLCEAIAATQVLNHTAAYPLSEMRDFAARLPFAAPLTTHAGVILAYMLTEQFAAVPRMHNARVTHLAKQFPYIPDMAATLKAMVDFWQAAVQVLAKLLEDEEAEPDFYTEYLSYLQDANAAVVEAFAGIAQVRQALPEINRPEQQHM